VLPPFDVKASVPPTFAGATLHVQTAQFQMPLADRSSACVHRWLPDAPPRAAIQVIHGMAEHGGRYARLAGALTAAGYAVYAQDLPGHGRSVRSQDELGHFADHHGWPRVLSAINSVRERIENDHPGMPVFALGHSMGSFLLQDYVIEHGTDLAGATFSAATADTGALRRIAVAAIKAEALWHGARKRSVVAEALTFRDFNRRFKPTRTEFDWLSRDATEVDRYVDDSLCGFRCSCRLWLDLLGASGKLGEPARLARIPRALPILIIGGSEDPATRGETGQRALKQQYDAAHLTDVTLRIYAGARHELFNETCRDEVTNDVRQWLDSHSTT
jgi:alpha-beta hydrolase superfamily lysophospholipase